MLNLLTLHSITFTERVTIYQQNRFFKTATPRNYQLCDKLRLEDVVKQIRKGHYKKRSH